MKKKILQSSLDLSCILYICVYSLLYYSERYTLPFFIFKSYARLYINSYTCICLDMRFIFVIIHLFLPLCNCVFVLRLFRFPEDNISCRLIIFTDIINNIYIIWLRKKQYKHIHTYKQKYITYVKRYTLHIRIYINIHYARA